MSLICVQQLLTGKARQVGEPGAADPMDRPWVTGIFKQPVDEEIWLAHAGLQGDEVGDTKNHGGPEKAVFAYPVSHYDYWQTVAGDMTIGAMGENAAITCADESSVCIGDVYQFHHAIVEISQPRQPCWRPARRFRIKDLALQIQQTGRTGWYFRVLEEGLVRAGAELKLLERRWPRWTIALCNEVMHHRKDDLSLARELAQCPHLTARWKETLEKRLAGTESSPESRLLGPNVE